MRGRHARQRPKRFQLRIIEDAVKAHHEPIVFGLLDYRGWPRRRLHSPRAERMKVKPPSPPSAQSVQTKKKPPVDLAISP